MGYTCKACVPLDSPLAKELSQSLQGDRNYEMVLELERVLSEEQIEVSDYVLIRRQLSDCWESMN